MVVNGIQIVIPKNLVITMPAAYKTPQQLFKEATGPSNTNNVSGLALDDIPSPLAAFEVAIDGNIVGDTYIAGLVSISQQSLNTSAGYIHAIDVNTGVICVGGNPAGVICAPGDARLRLNDPKPDGEVSGRYGLSNEEQFPVPPGNPASPPFNPADPRFPDSRFTVDQDNPTVHALTGFPMCVPRPRLPIDQECPDTNRPAGLTKFVMDNAELVPPVRFGPDSITACPVCDATKQAPLKVGDYITYAGTLSQDAQGQFISVHTLVANVGIYTGRGKNPAYVTLDESLIGTMGRLADCVGPAAAAPTAECQDRVKIEGFTTDPSRSVSLYALDFATNGLKPTVRRLVPGVPGVVTQAVFGRFRFVTGKNALALFAPGNITMGATRELMIRIDDPIPLLDGTEKPEPPKFANGLGAGQYTAPVGEYIFPEPTGVQGRPQPALNFECLAFLVNGWSPDEVIFTGQLTPWPGAPLPIPPDPTPPVRCQ